MRLPFHLRDAALYSFWVIPDRSGASNGYVAAGGPGFTAATDTVGQRGSRFLMATDRPGGHPVVTAPVRPDGQPPLLKIRNLKTCRGPIPR